jgi:hypothetical protein
MPNGVCKKLFFTCLWAMAGASLWAQGSTAPKPGSTLEVALTYSASYSNVVSGQQFWMQGGGVELHGQFWRGLGAVADVTGFHAAKLASSTVGLDLVTAAFGPRYSWLLPHSRFVFFGQMLAGEANGLNSTFPGAGSATSTADGLALQVGGGMNVKLKRHIALRAFQADWLRTQLPNSTTNVQNNLRVGGGIILSMK